MGEFDITEEEKKRWIEENPIKKANYVLSDTKEEGPDPDD